MITVLNFEAYQGFLAYLGDSQHGAKTRAQPAYIGRVLWPGQMEPEEVVIKLYETHSCGIANEAIGYMVNTLCGVPQPRRGGVLLLPQTRLPDLPGKLADFIDPPSGIAACWITTFEQNTHPIRYMRKLASFSQRQSEAFYMSAFCKLLATVDHVTGNNDRHEGNVLYLDDLKYLAIDQGNVGGGIYWNRSWPDQRARNELIALTQQILQGARLAAWISSTIMLYEKSQSGWEAILAQVSTALPGLLEKEEIDTIINYMRGRATGTAFAASCGKLI
jgi:hypothetical protein